MNYRYPIVYYGHSVDPEMIKGSVRGRLTLFLNRIARILLRWVEYHVMILYAKKYKIGDEAIEALKRGFEQENKKPVEGRSNLSALGVDGAIFEAPRYDYKEPTIASAQESDEVFARLATGVKQKPYTLNRDQCIFQDFDDAEVVPASELITKEEGD
jgi:hypothetical protein